MDRQTHIDWLFNDALPLWSTNGWDNEYGGFFDALDFGGQPVPDLPKRMRVQARQAYAFCHAASCGWKGDALSLADRAFDFLFDRYWHADGGLIFSVSRQGAPRDDRRESYEQAFALLALGTAYGLKPDPAYLKRIDQVMSWLDTLRDPVHGGYQETAAAKLPRRQNPHMHLLEAFLTIYETTGQERFLQYAEEIFELFERAFFDSRSDTLGEYFDAAWKPADNHLGDVVEPGHHFEWIWLLEKFGRLSGRDTGAWQHRLFAFADSHGIDNAVQLAYDEVGRNGQIHAATKRLWPQTEFIKALVSLYRRSGDDALREKAFTVAASMKERYFDAGKGVWRDQLGPNNETRDEASPASSLYHIVLALTELPESG